MNDTAADRARRAAERQQHLVVRLLSRDAAEQCDRQELIPESDRISALWMISLAAWGFAGKPIGPLRRDVARVMPRSVWEAE